MRDTELLATSLFDQVHNIGVTANDGRFALRIPEAAIPLVHGELIALGAKQITSDRGTYYSLAPPPERQHNPVHWQLRRISGMIPPARAKFARQFMQMPHPGLEATSDGGMLVLTAAMLPRTGELLTPLQPNFNRDGTISIRLDIHSRETLKSTLLAVADYYKSVLVPPTSPHTGLDLTEQQLKLWRTTLPELLAHTYQFNRTVALLDRLYGAGSAAAAATRPPLVLTVQDFIREQRAAQQNSHAHEQSRTRSG